MNEYLLLVSFSTQQTLTPDQRKLMTENWGRVIQQWTAQGNFAGSTLINQDGFVLSGSERKFDEGTVPGNKFKVVSTIHLLATSMKEATDLARACPTLDVGGVVEIREIQPGFTPPPDSNPANQPTTKAPANP